MKKNFFKKLSFVMALAMIISVIAPAAGAFAATGLRLNATTKTLFLGENNTYNFNALGKSKGATEKWTSSKTSVATVNAKNGVVTAKAVGTTTITATITNAKKTVTKKLTAKVTVGDNVKTLSVAAPAGTDTAKLVVGTDYALATSYVTKSGSKSKTSNTFAWSVDKEGATVSKTGVFKATVPGEYTVTVTANRYKNVKVADATIKVTVLNAIKEVKQTTTNAFTVEFAGAVKKEDLTASTASVAQIINGKDVTTGAEKIKSVTLDSTGKVATIELYADFVSKTAYKFVYGDLTGTFTAASKDVKDVAGIVFDDFTVNITGSGSDLSDKVHAVNADGVKILNGADLSAYLTFDMETSEQTKGYVDSSARKAYIYTAGNAITVKATFTNYVLDETTKAYKQVTFSDSAVGTGVTADVNTSTLQYAIAGTEPTSISTAWTSEIAVAVGDTGLMIYSRYKKTTDSSTYVVEKTGTDFTYVVSDPTKLSIYNNTVYALAPGAVTVIVKDKDGKVLGSFDVKINPERTLVALTPEEATVVTVGNNTTYGETKEIVLKVLDNLGSGLKDAKFNVASITPISKPSNASTYLPNVLSTKEDGKVTLSIDAKNALIVKGLYQYKVTVTSGTVTKDVVIGVNVADSSTTDAVKVANYVAVFETAAGVAKDKIEFADQKTANTDVNYGIAVYGINSSGFRVTKLANTAFTSEVKFDGNLITSGSSLKVVSTTNGALVLEKKGVYTLTVKSASSTATGRVDGSVLSVATLNATNSYSQSFAIKNPSVAKSSLTSASVRDLLVKALELSITKSDVTKVDFETISQADVVIKGINRTAKVETINLIDSVDAGNVYIESVTVYVDVDGASGSDVKKAFTFDVKGSINVR